MADSERFEAFYRENLARIVRACALVTLDRRAAEDVAAEAFARLWANWSRISGEDHAGAFVFRPSPTSKVTLLVENVLTYGYESRGPTPDGEGRPQILGSQGIAFPGRLGGNRRRHGHWRDGPGHLERGHV